MRAKFFVAVPVTMVLVSVLTPAAAHGQAAVEAIGQDGVTVPWIMQGPKLVGTSPSRLQWSPDGESLYFVWKRPGEEREGLYRVDRGGGEPERVADSEALRLESRLAAVYSDDRRNAAYQHEGQLFHLDVRSGRERLLVSVKGAISRVQISPDGSTIYFVTGDNLFRVALDAGTVTQLTDIRRGDGPPPEPEPGAQEVYLQRKQQELFRVFEADSLRRALDWPPDEEPVDTPTVFYLDSDERFGGYWVAPDGSRMAFSLTQEAEDQRLAWVPDYVTEEGYTEQAPRRRAFVGDEQDEGKLGIMDLGTGEFVWVDHGQDDRAVNLWFRGWSPDGDRFLAVGISDDWHDRWLFRVEASDGESMLLDHLHDEAWIGGPGWTSAGWLPGGDHVWFISEATGFAHLYTVAEGGGEPTPLTTGPWEVLSAEISSDEREWFLVSSEASPHERGFYRMNLDGSDRRLITEDGTLQGGRAAGNSVALSPDDRRLGLLLGWPNHPPELFLQDNKPGADPRRITESTAREFRDYRWREPEIIYFPARDGTDVPARLYRPERPNGAGVVFVHGAGYLQNVHRWWSSYYREYMFHNLLADRGYTVLDIDYRGSAGYGRDWRTAIHKRMGGNDLTDQVDGARYLAEALGVDPGRIGIYGGSYGGFLTLMAMFTEPGVFAVGAALRPVTDWAHYSHWYTSRILGLPQNDTEAYRRSSPIFHAEGLEGRLLIAHGMIDQNVHFQDTAMLAQRLIELGKENWEIALYPKEGHGFVHPWSWTDEYRRILKLFEDYLR